MTKPILAITLAISTCMTSACGPAPAPELKVFVSGAARDAFNDLAPQFERATGYKIKAEFDLPPALMRRIGAGEPFDVVILSRGIDELIEQGKVAPDSRVALGRTGVGVAIHRGTPTPDIATVDAFKYTLLRARSITYSGEGSSGQYFLSLLDRLQLANAIKPKLRHPAGSGGAAQILARGAGHRRRRHRLDRMGAGRAAELDRVCGRHEHGRDRSGRGARAAPVSHDIRRRRGVQVARIRTRNALIL